MFTQYNKDDSIVRPDAFQNPFGSGTGNEVHKHTITFSAFGYID